MYPLTVFRLPFGILSQLTRGVFFVFFQFVI